MPKLTALALTTLLMLAACGGGGSGSFNGGGGGGGGGGTQVITPPGPPNVVPLVVDAGPSSATAPTVNTAYVTVTVCVPPGFTTCQTIDHIQVDTGSVGLRVIASKLTLALPDETDTGTAGGTPLAECLTFADGTSIWGGLKTANIQFAYNGQVLEQTGSPANVQVIDDAAQGNANGTVPAACGSPNGSGLINTVDLFGANGILGIAPFVNDCNSDPNNTGGACLPGPQAANYYSCPTPTSCALYTPGASLAQQLTNPVILFAKDNNGTVIELPATATNGNASLAGSLVFGIGTETNNALGTAVQLYGDPAYGLITATLNGSQLPNSFLDTGSTGNIFASSIAVCPGSLSTFYCPPNTTAVSASLQGSNGAATDASFAVANAQTLLSTANTAFSTLAGPSADTTSLDFGLSFFYGRNVYTGIEDRATALPPYYAY